MNYSNWANFPCYQNPYSFDFPKKEKKETKKNLNKKNLKMVKKTVEEVLPNLSHKTMKVNNQMTPEEKQKFLYKTSPCTNILNKGMCVADKECTFAHCLQELNIQACYFGENCNKRTNCKFLHPNQNKEEIFKYFGYDKIFERINQIQSVPQTQGVPEQAQSVPEQSDQEQVPKTVFANQEDFPSMEKPSRRSNLGSWYLKTVEEERENAALLLKENQENAVPQNSVQEVSGNNCRNQEDSVSQNRVQEMPKEVSDNTSFPRENLIPKIIIPKGYSVELSTKIISLIFQAGINNVEIEMR